MVRSSWIKPFGIVALSAIALTAIMPVMEAAASHRHHRHHRHHGGDAFVAGVAGAIIGSALSGPVYAAPPPPPVVYVDPDSYGPYYPVYEPPAVVYQPPVVVYQEPQVVYEPPIIVEPKSMRRPLSEYNANRIHGQPGGPPKVITYDDAVRGGGLAEPWSEAWFDYCRGKFRSFDSKTGTYLGYDGHRHFCVVK
jgi:hypothetical protein